MRVDFYELGRLPAERVLPLLAQKALSRGKRLLVVSGDDEQLASISDALWGFSTESFLAHGRAGEGYDERHPILLSQALQPANGARVMAIADGIWREADPQVDRILYLFGDARVQQARGCWRELGQREAFELHIWKLKGGKWTEGS